MRPWAACLQIKSLSVVFHPIQQIKNFLEAVQHELTRPHTTLSTQSMEDVCTPILQLSLQQRVFEERPKRDLRRLPYRQQTDDTQTRFTLFTQKRATKHPPRVLYHTKRIKQIKRAAREGDPVWRFCIWWAHAKIRISNARSSLMSYWGNSFPTMRHLKEEMAPTS
jgi:hypothetical protein